MDNDRLVTGLRDRFRERDPGDFDWRRRQLGALIRMIDENVEIWSQALHDDLRKSKLEAFLSEVGFVRSEADYALKQFERWARPRATSTPLHVQPGKSRVVWEPLGVGLILGAWNYPLQLTLAPLVACIAAGNSAVLKPSEMAPATSRAIAELVPKYLDPESFAVVEGGVSVATDLLEQRFDKIFFTGNSAVARIVMTAAAKHLTPVILELGGKSPCIVDSSARANVAARRIVFGKFTNAGQTCVAPDYVLVVESFERDFLEALKRAIETFYGPDPQTSPNYARIVNARHFERLRGLLTDGEVVVGGTHDADDRYIAPTVLRDVSPEARVMTEEVFGPILPVLTVRDIDTAIAFVNAREKPLSLYLFAEDRRVARDVTQRTSSGGMCVNEALMHLTVHDLPFGGVGESGMGKYHGEWGFREFSNAKAVLEHGTLIDPGVRYPPYKGFDEAILRKLMG